MRIGMWCTLGLILLSSMAWAESSIDVHEGMWEITVAFTIPGMPAKMPSKTYTQCIRKGNPVPQDQNPNQQCTQKNVQVKGDTVTWTVMCATARGQMTGKGEATYHKDKMNGTMTLRGQDAQMVSRFKGHRMGSCK